MAAFSTPALWFVDRTWARSPPSLYCSFTMHSASDSVTVYIHVIHSEQECEQAIILAEILIPDFAVRVPRTACLSSGRMPVSILRIVSCACAASVL